MRKNTETLALAERIPTFYQEGKHFIAGFAFLAFKATDYVDSVMPDDVGWTCDELTMHIQTCTERLEETPYQMALCGSIWNSKRVLRGVVARLGGDYRLLRHTQPPVFGATLAAASGVVLDTS